MSGETTRGFFVGAATTASATAPNSAEPLYIMIGNLYYRTEGSATMAASMVHLANISYRVGRKLALQNGSSFFNDAEAMKLLTRNHRKPYII